MITVRTQDNNAHTETVLKPTIFPDGTSQVWKLPEVVLNSRNLYVIWHYESDNELMHLFSLRELLHPKASVCLHIPYLPYGRQDKHISNTTTFNLAVFAKLLNQLNMNVITTVDAHNAKRATELITGLVNIDVQPIVEDLLKEYDCVVFPDAGAYDRYKVGKDLKRIICYKTRDQATGEITGMEFSYRDPSTDLTIQLSDLDECDAKKLLIVDDLCDYGNTFINVSKKIHSKLTHKFTLDLYVTHGLFSGGRDFLLENGINKIYTTNSLIRNKDGIPV